jgi:hypothetical protein
MIKNINNDDEENDTEAADDDDDDSDINVSKIVTLSNICFEIILVCNKEQTSETDKNRTNVTDISLFKINTLMSVAGLLHVTAAGRRMLH